MNEKFYIWQQHFADGDDYGYPELGPSSVPEKPELIGESNSLSEAIAIAKGYEYPGKYSVQQEELNPKINGIEYMYSYTIDYGFNCNKYLITNNVNITPKQFSPKEDS